jgi:hypothetical protein
MFPISVSAQFNQIANELCKKNALGFVLIGNSELNNFISHQDEIEKCVCYEVSFDSELAKRFGTVKPTMYLFNKNMMVIHMDNITMSAWDVMRNKFDTKISNDCLITAHSDISDKITLYKLREIGNLKSEKYTVQMGVYYKKNNAEYKASQYIDDDMAPIVRYEYKEKYDRKMWTVCIGKNLTIIEARRIAQL